MSRLTKKQIALVHVACKELGILEDDRHRIQEVFGGSRSLKTMSQYGWEELVRHLEACGFRSSLHLDPPPPRAEGKGKLTRKIYALWDELEGSYYEPKNKRRALRGFLKKRFHVDHERFLDVETAIKVVEAIKAIRQRRSRQQAVGSRQ